MYMMDANLKEPVMELKEFYTMICDMFNDGKNLEYKWTRKDGYWKMTKGFINGSQKEGSLHALAQFMKEEREMKKKRKETPVKKKKTPYIKYKGA